MYGLNKITRRQFLARLLGLGAAIALPRLVLARPEVLELPVPLPASVVVPKPPFHEHPRIALLRSDVLSLPVDAEYKEALLKSIVTYRDQILARPVYLPEEGWDDLEAIQQVTLGDMNEAWFKSLRRNAEGVHGINSGVPLWWLPLSVRTYDANGNELTFEDINENFYEHIYDANGNVLTYKGTAK